MEGTRKPTFAGILLTISGAIPLTIGMAIGIYYLLVQSLLPTLLASIILVFAGTLPLISAVCSFRRILWIVVVVICIITTFIYCVLIFTIPLIFLVILALILILLSRKEFA